MTDALTEYSYEADLAGLTYNFASTVTGLHMSVTGYNDKLPVLAKVILEKATTLRVDPERLAVIKEQVIIYSLQRVLVCVFMPVRSSVTGRTSFWASRTALLIISIGI